MTAVTTNWAYFDIREMAESGMTLSDISEETGASYDAVRHAAWRKGVSVKREWELTPRDRVQGMKPADAIEYLLGCLENLRSLKMPDQSELDGFNLTEKEKRLVEALMAADGRTMTKEAIFDALYFDVTSTDEYPVIKIVDVFISKARKKIPPEFGSIETVWGHGVRFVRATQ